MEIFCNKRGTGMKLVSLSAQDFVGKLAERAPVPGGGSAGALCGALGAALCSMVSHLTLGRGDLQASWDEMKHIGEEAEALAGHFLDLVDRDAAAYQEVVAAARLPRKTEEEKNVRLVAIQEALKTAALVPLETLRAAETLLRLAKPAIELGNPNAVTDAGAALHLARATAAVAMANVRINLPAIEDEGFVRACRREVDEVMKRVNLLFEEADRHFELQLG
jgi:methenyltetrahydrofolate cyclohydrolase